MTLELVTNGFYGEPQPDGTMRLVIPAYAYHQWRGELRYVLLLGDGSYDFKDYLGLHAPNLTTYPRTSCRRATCAIWKSSARPRKAERYPSF